MLANYVLMDVDMTKPDESKKFLQKNALQLTLQAVALFVLILNLWLGSKLAPLAQDLILVKQTIAGHEADVVKFVQKDVLAAELQPMKNDIQEIKTDVKSLLRQR